MLSSELTPRTARRERWRAERAAVFAAEHEELFLLLTVLRAASAESLHALYFQRRPAPTSLRQTYRALRALHERGLLERQHLNAARVVYRLSSKGYASSPRVHRRASDSIRKPLPEALAGYCWLRSSVWAELTIRGYRVGRGVDEQRAIRRFLIDNQRAALARATGSRHVDAARVLDSLRSDPSLTPLFRSNCPQCGAPGRLGEALDACPRCGAQPRQVVSPHCFKCTRCGRVSDAEEAHKKSKAAKEPCDGTMREIDHVPFDVAWRQGAGTVEAVLVLVDDPVRSMRDQLDALPLRVDGQPKVPIVLRTTDEHSVFNPVTGAWIAMGDRHRELLRAFSEEGDRRLFPFSLTAEVIDVRPELQLRLRPTRKEASHA